MRTHADELDSMIETIRTRLNTLHDQTEQAKEECAQTDLAFIEAMGPNYPKATLSNGVRVANFSFPHNLRFVDGTLLLACPAELFRILTPTPQDNLLPRVIGSARIWDVIPEFELNRAAWLHAFRMARDEEVDIIFVPREAKKAMYQATLNIIALLSPVRESLELLMKKVRLPDKVQDSSKFHIDRFAL